MEIELKTNAQELKSKFVILKSRADVADILEISDNFLCKILYGLQERKKYRTFEIKKKSSKTRQISVPPKNIAILQSKLHCIFKIIYEPKYCVHGFVSKKSILSNAEKHTSKCHVINIDLKDFFPSIHLGRIRGALVHPPFNIGAEAANVIAQICCTSDGILPQGGATSPILSNIICRSLDNDLMKFARENRCNYTRYADDMTFSSSSFHLPKDLAFLKNEELILSDKLISIIKKHKFEINNAKTRYIRPFARQDVTGLTVNQFPNIKRSYVRSILGALHAWEKYDYDRAKCKYLDKYQPQNHGGVDLHNVIKGKIAFVKMILGDNSPLFRKLAKRFNNLSPETSTIKITPLESIESYPLRGQHLKKAGWELWFNKYKKSIIFLEIINIKGDICTGTAFYIGNGFFATAGHNLKYKNAKLYFGESSNNITDFTEYNPDSIDIGMIKYENLETNTLKWLPTQLRLPQIGEEVAAIGYPCLPLRNPTLVMHVGIVEALPVTYNLKKRFIQVSFQSGGGLSGGCLIDKGGFVVGIMIENIFNETKSHFADKDDSGTSCVPTRPYGQAVPIEYLADKLNEFIHPKT